MTHTLTEKNKVIFKNVVDAVRLQNTPYSHAYATELHENRKMNNMVTSAKLAMEQIQLRLNTISELGDVVVTLSPCMSIIKGLSAGLGGLMPEANSSMQDLSTILGDIMAGASVTRNPNIASEPTRVDTTTLLEEAHAELDGQ